MYYLMISSVINLVLDILFIEVFHTGVGGAALATVISQVFSAILCLIQLLRTHDSYQLQITKIRFDAKMLGQIIRIGLPSGVQNSIIAFANVTFRCLHTPWSWKSGCAHDHYDGILVCDPGRISRSQHTADPRHSNGLCGLSADMGAQLHCVFLLL